MDASEDAGHAAAPAPQRSATRGVPAKRALAYPIAAALRQLRPVRELASRFWYYTRLRSLCPTLHPTSVVLGPVDVHGSAALRFGRDLFLYSDLHLETRGRGCIALGDRVVLSRGVHIVAFDSVTVGDGSMIGEYSSLRDANHRFGAGALRDAGHVARPIRIGCDAWIGRGVTVLPGVVIGDGAVVGANAVVTRDVAAGSVVAGVPARPIAVSASRTPSA